MNYVIDLKQELHSSSSAVFTVLSEQVQSWWGDGEPYVHKVAPERVTLKVEVDGSQTLIMLMLEHGPTGAALHVVHTRFPSAESRDLEFPCGSRA